VPESASGGSGTDSLIKAAIDAGFTDLAYCMLVMASCGTLFNAMSASPDNTGGMLLRGGLLIPIAVAAGVMCAGCIKAFIRAQSK
jgi:hypothetical protein